jgi:hypothetical protein
MAHRFPKIVCAKGFRQHGNGAESKRLAELVWLLGSRHRENLHVG